MARRETSGDRQDGKATNDQANAQDTAYAAAERLLDSILTQLAAGGGKVGRWASRLMDDGAEK